LETAESCPVCNRICIDLLPEYEVYPIYELADCIICIPEIHTVVQFEGYFCPFSCEGTSISESDIFG